MPKPAFLRRVTVLMTTAILASAVFAAESPAPTPSRSSASTYMGIANPSNEATISFTRTGPIDEFLVKEGDEVKEGQVLVVQDMKEEMAQLAVDEFTAKSEVQIEAEKAVQRQKQADFDRMNDPRVRSSVSVTELNAAALEIVVADARIKLAQENHVKDGLKLDQTKVLIGMRKRTAPLDGVVQQIYVRKGESADAGKQVMTIIQNDPLYVEVPLPILQAQKLKKGDIATVDFTRDKSEAHPDIRQGKVLLVFSRAETGSQTIKVRLEVPNPQKTQSGGIVDVNFAPSRVAQK